MYMYLLPSKLNCNKAQRKQCGRVIRAPHLKSVGPGVQIPFRPLANVVLSSPEFNSSAALVNSKLVCLLPVGVLNLVMFSCDEYLFIIVCLYWS